MAYYELIRQYGYNFEEHKITTEDGYILTAWRINKNDPNLKNNFINKKTVILNHGLLDNAITFFAHGKKESLPFILADDG